MKIRLIITLITLAVSLSSWADTCPPLKGLNPNRPPAGWSLLIQTEPSTGNFYFGAAAHSFNGSFYQNHIICGYETCGELFCPRFELLSDKEYEYPLNERVPPWDKRPSIENTVVCRPADHNPAHCVFQ